MDAGHLQELADLEERYWWHVAKRELVVELLRRHAPPPARLVEAGTGAGGNAVAFSALGYEVVGFDVSYDAVDRCRRRGLDRVVQHDVNQPWPLIAGSQDIAVLLDVIEHCPDPAPVWRHATRALRPGGVVIVNVPAVPWLFGPWDTALGHHRRYTARQLRREAANVGLREVWLSHWNAFSLPPAIAVRTVQRLRGNDRPATFPRVPELVNQWLVRCACIERNIMRSWPLPCGLSVAAVFSR